MTREAKLLIAEVDQLRSAAAELAADKLELGLEIERLRTWVERLLAEHNTYHSNCSVYSPPLERQT